MAGDGEPVIHKTGLGRCVGSGSTQTPVGSDVSQRPLPLPRRTLAHHLRCLLPGCSSAALVTSLVGALLAHFRVCRPPPRCEEQTDRQCDGRRRHIPVHSWEVSSVVCVVWRCCLFGFSGHEDEGDPKVRHGLV